MDTEKQRQRRRDDARLTESGNTRSEQLLVVHTESLTNTEWLPGELLSGSECQMPSWFLDMKYQTCYAVHLDVDVQWNFSIPDTLGLACYKDAHICDRI